MNKEYLKHAIVLCIVAIACLFGGISLKHWALEIIAVFLFVMGYILLFIVPESNGHGKKPRQKQNMKKEE
jgi:hypothetical protein